MHTTFQSLCIRPEIGFSFDKSSMVELAEGSSFSEVLCRVTSKVDTSLLLLSSHKGQICDFRTQLIGFKSPEQAYSISSVLSNMKKGLSFLSRSYTEEEPDESTELEKISDRWSLAEKVGYHGLQIVALMDKTTMPNNESRYRYNIGDFASAIHHAINAYYMFEKPETSFLSKPRSAEIDMLEVEPQCDTYAVALMWEFYDNPLNKAVGRRVAPLVSSSFSKRTPKQPSVLKGYESPSFNLKTTRNPLSLDQATTPVEKKKVAHCESQLSPIKVRSPVDMIKNRSFSTAADKSESEEEEEEMEEAREPSPEPKVVIRGSSRCPKPAAPAAPVLVETKGRRGRKPPVAKEIEVPPSRESKITSKSTSKKTERSTRRGTKRPVEDDADEEEEIVIKKPMLESMEVDENQDYNNCATEELLIKPEDLALPEESAPKPRVGRKSMVASARKSLANEWPPRDQDHMLHFFDNLNPQQSETSRIALTCKYALLQYNRDLSSKLLFQWVERKGRPVQRQVTDFTLREEAVQSTVLELFKSLSDVQTEATRVSFTLKFMKSQYGVSVTSKQLFGWLKEKTKK